jgi:hypothetical protein
MRWADALEPVETLLNKLSAVKLCSKNDIYSLFNIYCPSTFEQTVSSKVMLQE